MRTEEHSMRAFDASPMPAYGVPDAQHPRALRAEHRVEVAPHLPSFEFSVSGLARSDQFAAWHDTFAPILELTEINDSTSEFHGAQVLWDLGSLVFAQIITDELAFTSLPGHVRREPLDHWAITLLLSGRNRTDSERRTFSGGPGEVQIHPFGRPFAGDISKSEMLMLFVPRDFSHETAVALSSAELSKLGTGMGSLFSDYLIGVANRLPLLTQDDLPGLVAATRAMILACVSPSTENIEDAAEPITGVLLERARKIVQTHLFDPRLGVELVRRELGVSRTRLYNLFEPFGGVMHYIQHRRLLGAHSALADSDDHRLILRIAEEHGFSDGAEFSRAFKREFGYSPSEVRKGGQGAVPLPRDRSLVECAAGERLSVLLRRLQG
ncbi:MAG TPA: AraC family transcriptional regulator [Pararhizobium sp.]|uniref:AraC family transcriptional regulator n=1 Tax=Pararhizobium sp. TaxID=1977563 RepID=UPI002C4635D0|nr:AraC family transcriptional regulator [Pararhizobium sp.]HTO31920.1 AraC family transcriptional regulator [Pararhizobium sp.]